MTISASPGTTAFRSLQGIDVARFTSPGHGVFASDANGTAPRDQVDRSFAARLCTDLDAIAAVWSTMQRDGFCTPYQRLEWTEGLIRHLAVEATPLFIEITDTASGQTVLILPMALMRGRTHRVIEWLDLGVCDYAAPLMAQGLSLSPGEMRQIWALARSTLPPSDIIRITRIPSAILGQPNPLVDLAKARPIAMRRSGLLLDGEAETLLKRVCSPSAFKGIVKRRKRLATLHDVRFVCAETESEVATIFDVLVQQRKARFHEMGRVDLLDRPDAVAFYREMAIGGLGDGRVRVFGISVDGTWVATAYCLVQAGALHGVLLAMGGDEWRSYGPGILIVSDIMVWAREQGLDYMDFTVGAHPYKSSFRPVEADLLEMAEARTLRGRLALGGGRMITDAKSALEAHPSIFMRLRAVRQRVRRLGRIGRTKLSSVRALIPV